MKNIKRKHILWMFNWCEQKFGKSKFNNDFKVKISRTCWEDYGEYDCDGKVIQVNLLPHKSFIELCDTIIHEYTHYLQNIYMYEVYLKKYSRNYDNHPYEISADNKAKKYRKNLRADFKKEFGFLKF
jgi:hypothetical protein